MNTVAQLPMYGWDTIPLEETPAIGLQAPKADSPSHSAMPSSLVPRVRMTNVKRFEEPYDGKLSRTVLQPSGGGDPVA
jgi:hypothetical protein